MAGARLGGAGMTKPNERVGTYAGIAGVEYTLDISGQYTTNVITIIGPTSGKVAIRAIEEHNKDLEDVEGGIIYLPNKTKRINGYQLKKIGFTLSESAAFTAFVTQTNPVKAST